MSLTHDHLETPVDSDHEILWEMAKTLLSGLPPELKAIDVYFKTAMEEVAAAFRSQLQIKPKPQPIPADVRNFIRTNRPVIRLMKKEAARVAKAAKKESPPKTAAEILAGLSETHRDEVQAIINFSNYPMFSLIPGALMFADVSYGLGNLVRRSFRDLKGNGQREIAYLPLTENSDQWPSTIPYSAALYEVSALIGATPERNGNMLSERMLNWTFGVLHTVPTFIGGIVASHDVDKNAFRVEPDRVNDQRDLAARWKKQRAADYRPTLIS